ncbi:MAG TPA: Ig-like domain-containing protein, partial [Acidimicrobiia bacterium]
MLALLAVGQPPVAATTSLVDAVCGTWVLQEAAGVTDLQNSRSQIDAALSLPGVVGYSLRFRWNVVDTDFSLLEAGLAIAQARGKAFSIRPMAGRHTPARVFDAGSPFYMKGSEKVPAPFYPDGSPNLVFESAYDEFAGRLAAWSRSHGVSLLHLPWYGQDWAELNHGPEVRAAPGYSLSAWTNAHKRLIEIAARHSGADLAVELPLTGSGPLANGPSAALADHVIATAGADSDRFFVQANGWGPNGEWGTTSATTEALFDQIWPKPVRRGLQAIQPQDYDWTQLYASLYAIGASYAEVYLPSFSLASRALLADEIARFAATRCAPPAPTDTTPPEVTVTAPPADGLVAGNVAVSIDAVDAGGSVTGIDLLVDGTVAGSAGAAPATIAWDSTAVPDGAHELTARASDGSGNVGTSPPVTVTVDNTAPDMPGGLSAVGGDGEITVTFNAVAAADLAGYEVRRKLSAASTWGAPVAVASTTTTFSGLTAGTSHDFSVRSLDTVGNTSAWSEPVSAVVSDGRAPDVVIASPADGTRLGGTVDVTVETSDDSGSVVRVELLVDGEPAAAAEPPTPTIAWDSTTVPDGAHDLSARAVDANGNAGASPARSVYVDNTAPTVPGGLAASAGDGEVTVTFDAVADADVEAYEVRTRPSASVTWAPPVVTASTSVTFAGLANGSSYDFSARSRDLVDHTSAWSETVSAIPAPDVRVPVVAITAPAGAARVAGTVGVVVDVSDDEGSVALVELLVDGIPAGSAGGAPATIGWDTTAEADGPHLLRARAVDAGGLVGTSDPVSVTVDNSAPAVPGGVAAAPGDGEVTVAFTAVTAGDLAGYEVRMKPSSSSAWGTPVSTAATSRTFTGLTNGTSYDFAVRSLDTLSQPSAWSATVSATPVAPDTQGPSVTITAPAAGARV